MNRPDTILKKFIVPISLALVLGGCAKTDFSHLDQVVETAIEERIFPGAVVLVGTADEILYEKAYGRYTYAADAPAVTPESLFDMASLTKVFATSMAVMKCIDSGLVDPELPVVHYLPEFDNHGKDKILVKHLLMHNSGLPAYARAGASSAETLDRIMNIEMARELGDYTYSCLNFITLMRVVESASGKKMWEFYKETFTDPMGLHHTLFAPPEAIRERCLPTIGDSSGTEIRLQGKVHDPLALSLEGYSGNAGLFSTASDLAAFCRLMLNDGVYQNRTYVKPETLLPFKTLQSGSRAYGWGLNNFRSSAGSKMAETAIGHTGYTGTCAWIDLEKGVFVIFLTNRVFPLDQKSVTPVRRDVNDAAMQAVFGI